MIIIFLAGSWLVGVIGICQSTNWGWEQATFVSTIFKFDPRWIIYLVGSLAIWLPMLLLSRFALPAHRPIYVTWRILAELAILLTPARLFSLTSSQAVAGWQIAALGLYLVILRFSLMRRNPALKFRQAHWPSDGLYAVAGLGGALCLPWLAWGTLGSVMDTLLAGVVSVLGGLSAALAFEAGMFSTEVRARSIKGIPWQGIFAAPTALAILAFGLGLNLNEWLVLLAVPPLGWLASALASSGANPRPTWPLVALLLALGISGPLLWFDPDELALVVTAGSGELIEWASTAGLAALVISGAGAFLVPFVRSWWQQRKPPLDRLPQAFAIGAWLVVTGFYLFLGRPGFFGEQLFVILKDQPDLTQIAALPDPAQRRLAVYRSLTEDAMRSQADIRQLLSAWGVRYQPFYLVNALEVEGGLLVRLLLQNRAEVDRILDSPHLRPLPGSLPVQRGGQHAPASPGWNLTMLQARQVWDELGVTGKGVVIGQSDSGVDGRHPELASQYRGSNGQDELAWRDPWFHTRQPVDIGGHGTHTLGIALGKTVGVAPNAEWIGCVNLARNLGNPAVYLDCWQFMLAPFPAGLDPFRDGRPEMGANVLNNSWGCPIVEGCDPATFQPAVSALEAAGIFVVVSAGNEGETGCGSVTDPPAIYQNLLTVGAVDAQRQRATFSSLGPVTVDGSWRIKPDIMAPGVQILSAFPNETYERVSGTSMAGPHVAGTVALMWSANPKLIGDIERTRHILVTSAQPYAGKLAYCDAEKIPNGTAGYGIVNAYEAVKMALQAR